jgi:FkbH-like protein
MNYLEAYQLCQYTNGNKLKVSLLSSCNLTQLQVFLKAHAAKSNFFLEIETINFGVFQQHIRLNKKIEKEILLLFPWDLSPCFDWRTGFPKKYNDKFFYIEQINSLLKVIKARNVDYIFYLDAPIPQIFSNSAELSYISEYIRFQLCELNAIILKSFTFNLDSYLANGSPFNSSSLDSVAEQIINNFLCIYKKNKVLVTDLDNTLWSGILGEDGVDGIISRPEGIGYIHYIYQTLLLFLKNSGVLLAIVSKNDMDLIEHAFNNGLMLKKSDFVSIVGTYSNKADEIEALSVDLNIGLSDFLFIDDNIIELKHVENKLPDVACVQFPNNTLDFPEFVNKIRSYFPIKDITSEDERRTELYKVRRLNNLKTNDKSNNIYGFLSSLNMEIIVYDKTNSNKNRAIQLINKTNQFNLNGKRISGVEIEKILELGGKLFTAELNDISGSHGEIIVILINHKNLIVSFVMSCRVFQRNIEYLFLGLLPILGYNKVKLDYEETDRNSPFYLFLKEIYGRKIIHVKTFTITLNQMNILYKKNKDLFRVNYQLNI